MRVGVVERALELAALAVEVTVALALLVMPQ